MSVTEIQHGNVVIRIHRPTLTEEERQHREAHIISAMQSIGAEMARKEGQDYGKKVNHGRQGNSGGFDDVK